MASSAGAAIMIALPGCAPEVWLREKDERALLRMARLLYPHDALADEIYANVLQPLLARAYEDGALASNLRAGFETLDRATGREWRTAPPSNQLEALKRIEDEAFFETVRNAVRTQLYQRKEVWELIGYEGSSVEYGGYLERGFDDIDWLPEV